MENRNKNLSVLKICALMICLPLTAISAEPIEKYSIAPTDDGFVRTNMATGHTSLCKLSEDQLICRASIDEIQAFEQSTQQLQDRIQSLEAQITAMEESGKKGFDLSNSEEIDKAMDVMEGFMTRFFDMAKNLKNGDQG